MAKDIQCPNGSVREATGRACVGATVRVDPRSFGREIKVSRFLPHGYFDFTSSNAIPAKSKSDKSVCVKIEVEAVRKKGERKGDKYPKKVDLPYACPPRTKFENGRCSDGSEPVLNPSCGSRGKPCATERQTCPVQFVFKAGEPHLRFCGEKGQRAPLVKVSSPKEAQELARKACARWESTTKRYPEGSVRGDKKVGGQVKERGRYTSEVYKAPLGRFR